MDEPLTSGTPESLDDGGSVEVFANAADAQARSTYIDSLGKASPLFVEYDYLAGTALVRLSHVLTPDQGSGYKQAI